jgi:hypothetical protein
VVRQTPRRNHFTVIPQLARGKRYDPLKRGSGMAG